MDTNPLKTVLALVPMLALGAIGLSSPSFAAGNPTVDCDAGESLQAKVDSAKPGFVISVTGTCNERLTVETDDLTLDGGGTWAGDVLVGGATIDGTGLDSGSLVRIRGARIMFRGFTVRNRPGTGVAVNRSGFAIIQSNVIEDNASHGVIVNQGASAATASATFPTRVRETSSATTAPAASTSASAAAPPSSTTRSCRTVGTACG